MTTLDLAHRNGIPTQYKDLLFETMRTCSNSQRLMVCLFFLHDKSGAHLSDIESTLRDIFPPSIGSGFPPSKYQDFQATAVRQYFNFETKAVREGELAHDGRIWRNCFRGYWANTEMGNQRALDVLRRRGIQVKINQDVLHAPDPMPPPALPKLREEEDLAEQARRALCDEKPEATVTTVVNVMEGAGNETDGTQPIDLVEWAVQVINSLSAPNAAAVADETNVAVDIEGAPDEVAETLRALKGKLTAQSLSLRIQVNADGCLVAVSTRREG